MFIRSLLFAIAFIVTSAPVHSQSIETEKGVGQSDVDPLRQGEDSSSYTAKREKYIKLAPRIIFIPGIFGSQIKECESDGSQCKSIWGTTNTFADSNIDLTINPEKVYKTDVVEEFVFEKIYGPILNFIRYHAKRGAPPQAGNPYLTVFHYDWRRSNRYSAKLLMEIVCDLRKTAPNAPIIIIAHSMGGLTLKSWIKYHSSSLCAKELMPQVSSFIFVATPHLGSPKVIKAISDGYDIIFGELNGIKAKFMSFFDRIISELPLNYTINKAAASFESVYELLPIRSSKSCLKSKPSLYGVPNVAKGDSDEELDLFDPHVWERYDLLRRISNSELKRHYYRNKLPDSLRNAESFLCDIADFNMKHVGNSGINSRIVYFVGFAQKISTDGSFVLDSRQRKLIEETTLTRGDGTVPLYSAKNHLISRTEEIVIVEDDHVAIINNPHLRALISKWYEEARTRVKL